MSLVGERSILVVIFDDRTTIGMVRLYARETSQALGAIFNQIQANSNQNSKPQLAGDFASQAENRLDDIFQD